MRFSSGCANSPWETRTRLQWISVLTCLVHMQGSIDESTEMSPLQAEATPWRYTGSGLNCQYWLSPSLSKDSRCPSVTCSSLPTGDDAPPHYGGRGRRWSELELRFLSTQVEGQRPLWLTRIVAGVKKCCSGVWRQQYDSLAWIVHFFSI